MNQTVGNLLAIATLGYLLAIATLGNLLGLATMEICSLYTLFFIDELQTSYSAFSFDIATNHSQSLEL